MTDLKDIFPRDRMTFFKSYRDVCTDHDLSESARLALYDAITEYGMTGVAPELDDPTARIAFRLISENIRVNLQK